MLIASHQGVHWLFSNRDERTLVARRRHVPLETPQVIATVSSIRSRAHVDYYHIVPIRA